MAIEYGYRIISTGYIRWASSKEQAVFLGAKLPGFELVAREVSEPWVVSIRD